MTSQSVTSRAHHPIDPNRGFSFVIPYNQTQECNIYGPICQTGSITVGVDLTSTTTTTIMPCSSYLTAQSSYLYDFNPLPGAIKPYWPFEWQEGFGHSPQCTSYADVWEKLGKFTFSNCGSNDAIVPASEGIFLPSQIPPGVLRQIPYQVYKCCGNCTLDVKEVRLYYFRDETESSNYCHGNKTLGSPKPSSTVPDKKQAIPGLNNSNSIATLSGYTLYVAFFISFLMRAKLTLYQYFTICLFGNCWNRTNHGFVWSFGCDSHESDHSITSWRAFDLLSPFPLHNWREIR